MHSVEYFRIWNFTWMRIEPVTFRFSNSLPLDSIYQWFDKVSEFDSLPHRTVIYFDSKCFLSKSFWKSWRFYDQKLHYDDLKWNAIRFFVAILKIATKRTTATETWMRSEKNLMIYVMILIFIYGMAAERSDI